jgi:hypothetical protein
MISTTAHYEPWPTYGGTTPDFLNVRHRTDVSG